MKDKKELRKQLDVLFKFMIATSFVLIGLKLLIAMSVVLVLGHIANVFEINILSWVIALTLSIVMNGVMKIFARTLLELVEKTQKDLEEVQ